MMNRNWVAALYLTSAAAALWSVPSLAQSSQADDASGATASDIIVTARRVEEKLQDVPISITVFSQEQLEQHNVVSGEDLTKYTPSLSEDRSPGNQS
jgi:iron complex outermembrane receptor protein